MAIKYQPGGITVAIGRSHDVSLPPRVFRGRATCMHFDTDKSFLLPSSITGVRNIVTFFHRHPGVTMLVNGHTDLVGDPQYNLRLSNERAATMVAYLLNKIDVWLAWYSAPIPSKRWSFTEDQQMLTTITDPLDEHYYAGAITGINDSLTRDAVLRFQNDHGLDPDEKLGPDTRRALIDRYMRLEGTSLSEDTPIVMHGCGKFHPIDDTSAADEGNRRVEIFLFEGPVEPAPQDPCPAPGCTQYHEWVGNPEEDIDLCTPPLFDVLITVTDDGTPSQPISQAVVELTDTAGITVKHELTDNDGAVVFESIEEGIYAITVQKDGFDGFLDKIRVPGRSQPRPASSPVQASLVSAGTPPQPGLIITGFSTVMSVILAAISAPTKVLPPLPAPTPFAFPPLKNMPGPKGHPALMDSCPAGKFFGDPPTRGQSTPGTVLPAAEVARRRGDIAKAIAAAKSTRPLSAQNVQHWLDGTSATLVMATTDFKKADSGVPDFLDDKARGAFEDGCKARLQDRAHPQGTLLPPKPLVPGALGPVRFLQFEDGVHPSATGTPHSADLFTAVGFFNVHSAIWVQAKFVGHQGGILGIGGSDVFDVSILRWCVQIYDVYDWNVGSATPFAVPISELPNLPLPPEAVQVTRLVFFAKVMVKDSYFRDLEVSGGGRAYLVRTEPFEAPKSATGNFRIKI